MGRSIGNICKHTMNTWEKMCKYQVDNTNNNVIEGCVVTKLGLVFYIHYTHTHNLNYIPNLNLGAHTTLVMT